MPVKFNYNRKRYWYHVSVTLENEEELLIPRDYFDDVCFNRPANEPIGKRICVAPSIEQCLTAIPYHLGEVVSIYRTKEKVVAHKPIEVFDSSITHEGWLNEPTLFVKVGLLDFQLVEHVMKVSNVISEAASVGEPKYSGRVLKWWQRAKVKKLINQ